MLRSLLPGPVRLCFRKLDGETRKKILWLARGVVPRDSGRPLEARTVVEQIKVTREGKGASHWWRGQSWALRKQRNENEVQDPEEQKSGPFLW